MVKNITRTKWLIHSPHGSVLARLPIVIGMADNLINSAVSVGCQRGVERSRLTSRYMPNLCLYELFNLICI